MAQVHHGGVYETHGAATKDGKPFVIARYYALDGSILAQGQLSPEEAIAGGLRQIQAAIEAERDAGMAKYLHDTIGMEMPQVAALIEGMRDHREQWNPEAGRPPHE